MAAVTVRAPAKINLQLAVGAVRPDGYHTLVSVFQAVGLYDDVTATTTTTATTATSATPSASGVTVSIEGEGAGQVAVDETNLAARAALALARLAGVSPDVHLHLRKAIPVAAGMAGGSADAAAALVACDALWGLRLDRSELADVAAGLGADVPFALMGGTAVGVGTGTSLTPALARGDFCWVFALPDGGLSTPAVYAEYDRLNATTIRPEPRVSDDLMAALRTGEAARVGPALSNDLQRATLSLRPKLRFTLDVGEEYGALAGLVSGSGPTCAFLARDEEHALDLAVALSAAGVCRAVRTARAPVAGARIVEPEPGGP